MSPRDLARRDPEFGVERPPHSPRPRGGAAWLHPPITRARIVAALAVAVTADAVQLVLGPFGWPFVDEAVDVVAMGLTTLAIGFHLLLLPTFVLESMPVVDALPTWTGCVIAVIALRRRDWQPPG